MLRYSKVPLVFLFIGSLLGLFLRWQFIWPTPGVNYTFFLHGHSHVMFLGWIFNVLYIGFINNHVPLDEQSVFRKLFVMLQVLVLAMLISFPIQGYGFFSILFSTLHTFGALFFTIRFLVKTKGVSGIPIMYARASVIFFALSTAGPFSLGYLMANGLGQSDWYYFSIYFYLHFQYNGFFLFGVFSLLYDLLEKRGTVFDRSQAAVVMWILAVSCIATYALSVLWADPGLGYNITGGIAALGQIAAFILLYRTYRQHRQEVKIQLSRPAIIFLSVASIAFLLKLLLQFASAEPAIAQLAYELRPVVIAYLHLVLLGIISLALFIWYGEMNLLVKNVVWYSIGLFLVGFIGMELSLVLTPWWTTVFSDGFFPSIHVVFFFSIMLALSSLFLVLGSRAKT